MSPFLNVAVASLGPVGLDAKGDDRVFVLLQELKCPHHARLEVLVLEDEVVAGRHHNLGIGVERLDVPSRPGVARRGVAPHGLEQDLVGLDLWQLLLDYRGVLLVGEHYDIFRRNYPFETVYRELQQAPACSQEINKLFRHRLAAVGPEATAHTTTHYYTKTIILHLFKVKIIT